MPRVQPLVVPQPDEYSSPLNKWMQSLNEYMGVKQITVYDESTTLVSVGKSVTLSKGIYKIRKPKKTIRLVFGEAS